MNCELARLRFLKPGERSIALDSSIQRAISPSSSRSTTAHQAGGCSNWAFARSLSLYGLRRRIDRKSLRTPIPIHQLYNSIICSAALVAKAHDKGPFLVYQDPPLPTEEKLVWFRTTSDTTKPEIFNFVAQEDVNTVVCRGATNVMYYTNKCSGGCVDSFETRTGIRFRLSAAWEGTRDSQRAQVKWSLRVHFSLLTSWIFCIPSRGRF